MTGSFLDLDFTAAPQTGFAAKKMPTVYGGAAKAGYPHALRSDGRSDPSFLPPIGVPSSKQAAGPHLVSLPNSCFENGLEGWDAASLTSGSGAVAIDTATTLTGANSALLSTTAATSSNAGILTGAMFPCGAGIPLMVGARVQAKTGAPTTSLVVNWFKKDGTANGSANANVSAQITNSAMSEVSTIVVPPANTAFAILGIAINGQSSAATALWVNEIRTWRGVGIPYLPAANGVARTMQGKLDDVVSAADYPTLLAAAISCNSLGRTLYVPAGTYNVSGSITLYHDVVFAQGAVLSIAANTTVTFLGHIHAPLRTIFSYADSGTSAVVFTRGCRTQRVPVEWFGARDAGAAASGDAPFIQRAINACRGGAPYFGPTVYFSANNYQFTTAYPSISFYPDNTVYSEPSAHIEGPGTGVIGAGLTSLAAVILTTGNYQGTKFTLPSLATHGCALLLDRCNLADVELPFIQNCTHGLQMNTAGPSGGVQYTLLDNTVHMLFIAQCTQNATYWTASQNSDIMQGNDIYVNFINGCMRGAFFFGNGNCAPNWDSNKLCMQAFDAANISTATFLGHISGGYLSRFMLRVETWAGGIPANGYWISSLCYACDIYIAFANQIASYSQMQYTGKGNGLRVPYRGDDGLLYGAQGTTIGGFNGGVPITETTFVVSYTPGSPVAAGGGNVSFPIYHPLAAAGMKLPRVTGIAGNGFILGGLVFTANANEVMITIVNVLPFAMANNSTWKLNSEIEYGR